ncbi:MAG: carbamoyltransferase HypF [Thermoleophilia bacterium]|nr:carbamoyltransferase HypF [Thermoleophilia bacterium]
MSAGPNQTGEVTRALITVSGVVQGVGFRPFVFQQAVGLGLSGSVTNTVAGVEIDVEGPLTAIESLLLALQETPPPRASITGIRIAAAEVSGRTGFDIEPSRNEGDASQLVGPDSCTCDDCLTELFDPSDRRFHYPFINCTNCGPRFTIIEGLPYDRHLTTMKVFPMCPDCRDEYEQPADRRFHAEPNACPVCGPSLWLADAEGKALPVDDPVAAATAAMRDGHIVAIKGLGGFQLACLATDDEAVLRLRRRKRRPHKPFAVMVESAADAALHCRISPAERQLLEAVERPIVLLEKLDDSDISQYVAPHLEQQGMMLPCAPLHFLLMAELQTPIVMTSGNLSEEPICRTNDEAGRRLQGIADLFVFHDRNIVSTYDDSIAIVVAGEPRLLRRARGYAPLPVKMPFSGEPVLAVGGELKNTFCMTRGDDAFVSQHIGDLKDAETLLHYERTIIQYEKLLRIRPGRIISDSHPDYISTAYSLERHVAPTKVQHHKAHVASCLAENGFTGKAVGVALDGTGLGDDGAVWGGEFFVGNLTAGFERAAHFEYMPLLGGEAAVHEPWRMALAVVWEYFPEGVNFAAGRLEIPEKKLHLLLRQLEAGLNCPQTSSAGRLFDAVGSLAMRRLSVSYEAQAAIEFEALAAREIRRALMAPGSDAFRRSTDGVPRWNPGLDNDIREPEGSTPLPGSSSYRFSIDRGVTPWIISPARVIQRAVSNLMAGENAESVSRRFHIGVAEAIVRTSLGLAEKHDLTAVALSGGVFQNRILLELVKSGLDREGLKPLMHRQVPCNDGGLSLGQAVLAMKDL